MSLISSLEHAYATAAQAIVNEAKVISSKVLPALQKAEVEAPTIEAITALVSPAAANIERTGFAVLGTVIKAIEDAGTAATAGGLSISLDAALVADIKAIMPAVKSAAPAVTK